MILSALVIVCEACDGSGVTVFATRVYEAGCGFAHDSSDERPCEHCSGTGSEPHRVSRRDHKPTPTDDLPF